MLTSPSQTVAPPPGNPPTSTGRRASVAAFVCPATRQLGREAGFPVAVLAATTDVGRHAAALAATLYGALSPRRYEEWCLPFDEGLLFGADLAYTHFRFDARWLGSARLPNGVVIEDGCLRVDLPDRASVSDLGAVLRAGLIDLSFDRFARRPDRVRRRHHTHRPVVIAPRYTLVVPGDIERTRVADDLHRFGPGDLATVANALALSVASLALAASVGRAGRDDADRRARHG